MAALQRDRVRARILEYQRAAVKKLTRNWDDPPVKVVLVPDDYLVVEIISVEILVRGKFKVTILKFCVPDRKAESGVLS